MVLKRFSLEEDKMRYPKSCYAFVIALSVVILSGCSKVPTEDQLLKSATLHHKSDEFDEAISDFELLIQKYPTSENVPEALFAMGTIYLNNKKEYAKAESIYTKLVMDFPRHATAQGAAYQRARIFAEHLRKPDSAIAAYELFLQRYPDAVSAASAKLELAALRKK